MVNMARFHARAKPYIYHHFQEIKTIRARRAFQTVVSNVIVSIRAEEVLVLTSFHAIGHLVDGCVDSVQE